MGDGHARLPDTDEDDIEHTVKAIIDKEPTVLIYKIRSETSKDEKLRNTLKTPNTVRTPGIDKDQANGRSQILVPIHELNDRAHRKTVLYPRRLRASEAKKDEQKVNTI